MQEESDQSALKEELPLGEGVLTVHVGVPLVVLCTKSDLIQSNERGFYTERSLDTFFQHIRTNALSCTGLTTR